MSRLASSDLHVGTIAGIGLGVAASLLIFGANVALQPTILMVMPLSLIALAIGWLSTRTAVVWVTLFVSVLSVFADPVVLGSLTPGHVVVAGLRTLTMLALGLFALQLRAALRRERVLSIRDPLTGLLNRRGFFEFAETEAARSRRENTPFSVVLLDLDGFKHINDELGHQTGDRALMAFAEHMAGRLRATDVVARMGGDEFALVLSADNDEVHAILSELTVLAAQDGIPGMHASAGVASYTPAPLSIDEALCAADREMYLRKAVLLDNPTTAEKTDFRLHTP